MEQLIQSLYDWDALRKDDRIKEEVQDKIAPSYADGSVFQKIHPSIVKALRDQGVNRLFAHQGEAINKALRGTNIVLEAPTASGKTLSFAIPMMHNLLSKPGGHALMIYPMKAVAHDQRDQLIGLLKRVGLESWAYDGDTDKEHRKLIRSDPPHILTTNPEMVNSTFLSWNEQWTNYLQNLRFVVIDEMHEYRGYFGSNVALLLRRFSHHLARIGASPQFFLATATCANPEEHASNLTGQHFELVKAAGKLSPKRHFMFIDLEVRDFNFYGIFQARIINASLACLEQDKSVIVFCPSIRFAETCYRNALRVCEDKNLDKDVVALFKAGITADEKEAIQKGMKTGSKRLVFSTNALELGIDVGGLDGVILAGFPDTVMSAWQRIGRAGRSWESDAFVLYYAMNDPVNKFYANNLHAFLNKPLDEIVADPSNEELIKNHLPSLLHEAGGRIDSSSKDILGQSFYREAIQLASKSSIVKRYRPQQNLNLRGTGGKTWTLTHKSEKVGSISDYQRFREAYLDSIFLHSGSKYKVDSVTEGSTNEIQLGAPNPEYAITVPFFVKYVDVQDIFDGLRWKSQIAIHIGKTYLYEVLNSVNVVDERSDTVIDRFNPDGHSILSSSHAFWVDLSEVEHVEDEALYAFEQLLRIGTLFTIPADLHDTTTHTKDKASYLIENYPGGIGIVKKAFQQWHNILRAGIEIARACPCSGGCPNCIIPPRYYNHEKLDKKKGILLAEYVIDMTSGSSEKKFANGLWA